MQGPSIMSLSLASSVAQTVRRGLACAYRCSRRWVVYRLCLISCGTSSVCKKGLGTKMVCTAACYGEIGCFGL